LKWWLWSQFCQWGKSLREKYLVPSHTGSKWQFAFELRILELHGSILFMLIALWPFASSSLFLSLSAPTILFSWPYFSFPSPFLLEASILTYKMCIFWFVCILVECLLFCMHGSYFLKSYFLLFLIKHSIFSRLFRIVSVYPIHDFSLLHGTSLLCVHHLLLILPPIMES